METFSPAAARTRASRPGSYRPFLEELEGRFPPGVLLELLTYPLATTIPLWWNFPSPAGAIVVHDVPSDTGLWSGIDDPEISVRSDATEAGSPTASGTDPHESYILDALFPVSTEGLPWNHNTAAASLNTSNRGGRDHDSALPSAELAPSFEAATTTAASAVNGTAGVVSRGSSASFASGITQPPAKASVGQAGPVERPSAALAATPANKSYGPLPLHFEKNQGQADPQVQFVAPGSAYTVFLTGNEAVLSLQQPAAPGGASVVAPATGGTLRMQVVGAHAASRAVGEDELTGKVNYFLGNDPARWHTDIPTYAKVNYPDIYDGVDLVYYGSQQRLEYDFVVKPAADPAAIALAFRSADHLGIDGQGNLVLQTAAGTLLQHKPFIYQEVNGIRQAIDGGYVLRGPQQVGFRLGSYDPSRTLVIDPVLAYSTYLGGSADDVGNGIAVDGTGNVYLAGDATSTDFPTASAVQAAYGGGTADAFIAKLDPTGTTLLYATYLGGEGFDAGNGLAVDATGSVYITGKTHSREFPITRGAFEDTYRGDEFDAFVTKLSPAGDQLIYSTYLGGNDNDAGIAVAVDSGGNAYVTGGTKSKDFPATQSAYQGVNNGGTNAFVTELNVTGTDLLYSTFLGGSFTDRGNAIAVDANGIVYVAGHTNSDDFPTLNALQPVYGGGLDNAFVAKLNPQAANDDSLLFSTFLGGSGSDKGLGLAVNRDGEIYVAGQTSSADFPTAKALQPTYGGGSSNAFVAKIDSVGSSLLFATYLGGSGDDRASALGLDANGNVYVTGSTSSVDFPVVDAFQPLLEGSSDAFVAKLTSDGSTLNYASYLGGSGDEDLPQNGVNMGALAVDPAGAVYVTGRTTSTDFPTVNPLQPLLRGNSNAFVAKIIDPVPSAMPAR